MEGSGRLTSIFTTEVRVAQPSHDQIADRLERLANNQYEPNELRREQLLSGAAYQRSLAAAEASSQSQRDAARARREPDRPADQRGQQVLFQTSRRTAAA
jgi:hypothetical protein